MKTKTLIAAVLIIFLNVFPALGNGFFISSHDMEMSSMGMQEAFEMERANSCFRKIGSYSKIKCTLFFRNK